MAAPNWEFQSVSIDFEVFKALTARLQSPTDNYNAVLRRVLSLPVETPVSRVEPPTRGAWVVDAVVFPVGTHFRARYKSRVYSAVVNDGALFMDGQRFGSPSAAAGAITRKSVNGWLFWECQRPGETGWKRIITLRSRQPRRGA